MSRRPLPRSDPMGSFSSPGGLPSRLHVSPFSETVRILNRRVKPREVKRGRIILNLKVIDKAGRGSVGGRSVAAGRQNIPSRNRIIGKKGEAPYRPFQPPLKMLGFPMYGKPFGLQYGGPFSFRSSPATCSARPTHSTSSQYQTPPSPSSSSSSEGKSPTGASAAQSQPSERPKSSTTDAETHGSQNAEPPAPAPAPAPPGGPASLPSSPSSSSSDGDKEECALDCSSPPQECRKHPHHLRAKRQAAANPGDQSCPPAEPKRVPAEGDPDWHPEMAPSCKDVVVTDVTTNLVTVTIKEFPSHASPSPSGVPEDPSTPPPSAAVDSPSPPKP